jgi:hypothetical protein
MRLGQLRWALAVAVMALSGMFGAASSASAASSLPPIKHVFIIVLENESESVSFGASSPAPYLAKTLPSEGAFVPKYYGIGHNSLDNYIAMIGGQAPNSVTSSDCPTFENMSGTLDAAAYGQVSGTGCDAPTIANQLTAAGLTWKSYNEDMGNTLARDGSATCSHPALGSNDGTEAATAADQYATRHNPFVYYHSIIDDTAMCNSDDVSFANLQSDLTSAATTANYTFITPNLCDDGHDANCADGETGGLTGINRFLSRWVPRITADPAYQKDGLLLITFDEAATSDASACCGEQPGLSGSMPGGTGLGGGQIGAVLLSPFIKPGTTTSTSYNHYSMLGSVEAYRTSAMRSCRARPISARTSTPITRRRHQSPRSRHLQSHRSFQRMPR